MRINKIALIEAIKAIPQEEFMDIDELLQEIILITKIERGLQDMAEGRLILEDELDKIIEKW